MWQCGQVKRGLGIARAQRSPVVRDRGVILFPQEFKIASNRAAIDLDFGRGCSVVRPFSGTQDLVGYLYPFQRRTRRVIPHRACVSRWPASSP
jgi:hypothetical protein